MGLGVAETGEESGHRAGAGGTRRERLAGGGRGEAGTGAAADPPMAELRSPRLAADGMVGAQAPGALAMQEMFEVHEIRSL